MLREVAEKMIDRGTLRAIVDSFYGRVLEDEILAPVFTKHVSDWPSHLERMTCFWASILLRDHSYSGHPQMVHQRLPGLTPLMFERWLELFKEVVEAELGDHEMGQVMVATSRRMAGAMTRNLSVPVQLGGLRCK